MAGKAAIFQVVVLSISFLCIIIAISMQENAQLNLTFKLAKDMKIFLRLEHNGIDYGLDDKHFSVSYSDLNVTEVLTNIFDAEQIKTDLSEQLEKMTEDYKKTVQSDFDNDPKVQALPPAQKEKAKKALNEEVPDFSNNINDVTDGLDFADSLSVPDSVNDYIKYLGIPAIIMYVCCGLMVVSILIVAATFFEKLPDSTMCKCCTGCVLYFPLTVLMLVIGGIWIGAGQVLDTYKDEFDLNSATKSMRDSIRDSMKKFFADNVQANSGLTADQYDFAKPMDDFLKDFATLTYSFDVKMAPYFNSVAAIFMLIFTCTFCCMNVKAKQKEWEKETEMGDFP